MIRIPSLSPAVSTGPFFLQSRWFDALLDPAPCVTVGVALLIMGVTLKRRAFGSVHQHPVEDIREIRNVSGVRNRYILPYPGNHILNR